MQALIYLYQFNNNEVHMLNKSLYIAILSTAFFINSIQANDEIQLYSEAGYPYQNLINKAKTVKILFTDKNEHVYCRIRVEWSTQDRTTERVQVTKAQFKQKPLVSCLPRAEAKKLLANVYR